MAKVLLLCGKIGCGSDALAKRLASSGKWIALTCDELEQNQYDDLLGNAAGVAAAQDKSNLCHHALEIARAGANVVMDMFLPTPGIRSGFLAFFRDHGVEADLLYLPCREDAPQAYLLARKRLAAETRNPVYAVDWNTLTRINRSFQVPGEEEDCLRFG